MAISTEQKVGLFFLMTVIVLGLMIELVEDWRPFEDQYDYHAYFKSAIGLRVSDPVRIAGVEMGKVRNIVVEDNHVRVDFYVTETDRLRTDTIARIRQTNLLGGVFLGLSFGSEKSGLLPPGSAVQTEEGANIDQLITNIDRNQERVLGPLGTVVDRSSEPLIEAVNRLEKIMVKIDEGEGTLGLLVNNPSLYEELTTMSSRLNSVLVSLEEGQGSLGKMLNDPQLYDNLNRTMADLAVLTEQIKSGEGTLGKLANDESLYNEAVTTMANLRELSDTLNRGEGSLGRLLHDDTLYDNLNTMVVRINSIATKIDEGQGTIGRLVNEDELYRDAKTTLHKVEKSVDGISDTGPLSALGVVLGTLF